MSGAAAAWKFEYAPLHLQRMVPMSLIAFDMCGCMEVLMSWAEKHVHEMPSVHCGRADTKALLMNLTVLQALTWCWAYLRGQQPIESFVDQKKVGCARG